MLLVLSQGLCFDPDIAIRNDVVAVCAKSKTRRKRLLSGWSERNWVGPRRLGLGQAAGWKDWVSKLGRSDYIEQIWCTLTRLAKRRVGVQQ